MKTLPIIPQWLRLVMLATLLAACSGQSALPALSHTELSKTTALTSPSQIANQSVQSSASPINSAAEKTLEDLYARINPSVVNITVVLQADAATSQGPDTQQRPQGSPASMAQGSGFVYDLQGDIVTNNHVIDGATKITVTFADGVEAAATLIGHSADADLAVIKVKVDASELHPLTLAESDALKVGQSAIAIGNPFGLEGSMTTGIVSGLGRLLADGGQTPAGYRYSIPDIIQTDAAINPGNSGGPLLDLTGDVIGVNTAIEAPTGSSVGVGYAIPADIVQRVVPDLIKVGKYQFTFMGITGTTLGADLAKAMKLDTNQRGVLVVEVTSSSPAAKAGLRPSTNEVKIDDLPAKIGGDVIVSIDGQAVKKFDDLLGYLVRHTSVGQTVTLGVLRDGKTISVAVTLAARPTAG